MNENVNENTTKYDCFVRLFMKAGVIEVFSRFFWEGGGWDPSKVSIVHPSKLVIHLSSFTYIHSLKVLKTNRLYDAASARNSLSMAFHAKLILLYGIADLAKFFVLYEALRFN